LNRIAAKLDRLPYRRSREGCDRLRTSLRLSMSRPATLRWVPYRTR
jgi:hypothetical protein